MTLKDLKKRVPVADEKKVILRKKELLNTGAEIVVKEIIEDGVEISVYDNGYVLYEEGRHRTVFRLEGSAECLRMVLAGFLFYLLPCTIEIVIAGIILLEDWIGSFT